MGAHAYASYAGRRTSFVHTCMHAWAARSFVRFRAPRILSFFWFQPLSRLIRYPYSHCKFLYRFDGPWYSKTSRILHVV